jgi:hypothetical protein
MEFSSSRFASAQIDSGRQGARVYEVAAGAPEDEGRELPLLVAGALSTLRASTVEDARSSEIRQVPVRTLDSILAEAGFDRDFACSVSGSGLERDGGSPYLLAPYRDYPH